MSRLYRHLIRPLLFEQDSEQIHDRTLRILGRFSRHEALRHCLGDLYGAPELPVGLFGLRFPNPVGLAAGMDKEAAAVPVWPALGFGFSELGGVTWHPQPGNPKPRLFRIVPDQALINRMGFNNPGAEALAARLAEWKQSGLWPPHPVGINLGKSKITPLEHAAEDYARSFRALQPCADFFVVNVSSPNTPNLRQLQDKAALDEILAGLQEVQNPRGKVQGLESEQRNETADSHPTSNSREAKAYDPASRGAHRATPICVKVAPDLSFAALDEILELVEPRGIAGIVATNTTIARPEAGHAQAQRLYSETGGLSGRPLQARSTEVIRHIFRQTRGKLPIIGVGGIFNAADAWEKITAGASLIQVYTGMVYEGPSIAKEIVRGLQRRLETEQFSSLREAVGSGREGSVGLTK